jgi:uncharacterized protein YjdB
VSPDSIIVDVADSNAVSVTVRDVRGAPVSGAAVTWASSDTSIVRISANGFAVAIAQGDARITATSGGKSGSSSVRVRPRVGSVTVTPGSASGVVGTTTQFAATVRATNGNVLARPVTWASSNAAVATVSATGLAQAVSPGAATITAVAEGKSGAATMTVTAPPAMPVTTVAVSPGSASVAVNDSGQFSATARDANGAVLTGRPITWSTTNASVVVVKMKENEKSTTLKK